MNRYIIGGILDGYSSLQIEDSSIQKIQSSIVIVILREDSNNKLYEYYIGLKALIKNGNRVILVMVGSESKIRKQLCMLMTSYGMYDIYTIDGIEQLTIEYVNKIIARTPTEEEVRQYIGSDNISYSKITDILLGLNKAMDNADIEEVKHILSTNKDIITSSVEVIDYMKKIVDSVNIRGVDSKINELKQALNGANEEVERLKRELKDAKGELDNLSEEKEAYRKEAAEAKYKIKELEEKSTSTKVKTPYEVITSLIKCKTNIIVYFKEIAYVRYVNSLMNFLLEFLNSMCEIKTKLVIYDDKEEFSRLYYPASVIESSYYSNKRAAVLEDKNPIFVITDANTALLEDIVQMDYEVVLVYDRLKTMKDLISGNNVYKYWIINSRNEYNILHRQLKIDKRYIISRPGVFPEGIGLSEIDGFSEKGASARKSAYFKLLNDGISKGSVLGLILERTNLHELIKSKGKGANIISNVIFKVDK